jgi:ribosomal-protein-alanine N-acetyltransferase
MRWIVHFFARLWQWLIALWHPAHSIPHISHITIEHAANLAIIHAQGFAAGWDVLEFQQLLRDPAVVADGVFLSRERTPIGFILSRKVLDEAEIITITLSPIWRGQGLSKQLLKYHLQTLATQGVRHVFLDVNEDNVSALKLYARFHFTQIGRREAYYRTIDGKRAAALTMRLKI